MIRKLLMLSVLCLTVSACDDSVCKNECIGNTAITCTNGRNTAVDCKSQICVNAKCVDQHICDTDDIRCSTDGIPEKCIDNAWVAQKACGVNQQCYQGNCELNMFMEGCVDGDMKCSDKGIPMQCMQKMWKTLPECAQGKKCEKGQCI